MKWSDGQPATVGDACFSWQLALDAIADGGAGSLGAGYLDPGLEDAKVTKVECPDPTTMIVYTEDASDRILQTYLPIIPKHIWGKETYKTIGDAKFEVAGQPLVGTGPYQAVEWKTGQFVRFVRNPNYWGKQGFADEVVIQLFKTADTMVQALKAGELDYAHELNPDQFKQLQTEPNIKTVVGAANGWTQLASTPTAPGPARPSRAAGRRPRRCSTRRSATPSATRSTTRRSSTGSSAATATSGTTIVPPVLTQWHVEPTTPRTFDLELAKQKLDAAGYTLDASGKRLDKEGKPISLRMFMPNTSDTYTEGGPVHRGLVRGSSGSNVTTQVLDSATARREGPAAGGRRRLHGRLRHRALGLGRQRRPERAAPDLQVRRDRQLVGQPVLQPGVRQAVRRTSSRRRRPRSARRSSRRCRT